jgi:hypothetical protein
MTTLRTSSVAAATRARSTSIPVCGTSIVNGRTAVALVVQSDVATDMVASGWLRVEAPKNSSTAASSNEGVRHVEWPDRPPVSQRGNRRLNHALDLAAICQIRTWAHHGMVVISV